jgi:hypothetical protein
MGPSQDYFTFPPQAMLAYLGEHDQHGRATPA